MFKQCATLNTDIVVRWHGSMPDSRIFDNSVIRDRFEADEISGYLLGDSGYPCRNYLLTPLSNPHTESEHRYNTAHKKTRNKIECAGVWKKRFPILSVPIRVNLSAVPQIVVATAVLHNIALQYNEVSYSDSPAPEDQSEIEQENEASTNSVLSVRNTVVQRFFSG